jgi:hypothetical protein
MDIVIERVAANGHGYRRDVKACRAVRIGVPKGNTDELFSFQFENTAL